MTPDEQAIAHLIATWLDASKAGDTDAVLRLMADDVVFLVPGHPPMRGKPAFAASARALRDVAMDATSEVREIRVFGEWAYAWTELTVVMAPRRGGPPVKRSGPVLSVLKKEGGSWVLFRDANLLSAVQE